MRRARLEAWSRGTSVIHRRHPVAKILASLALLIAIATLTFASPIACGLFFLLLLGVAGVARLPVTGVLRAAATVLPFALFFAIASVFSGQPDRALMVVLRAFLSALTAVVLISTTTLPDLVSGFAAFRAPGFLLDVMQFLYRYLNVLAEEAAVMRMARACRGGSKSRFEARRAGAALSVLFARSWKRAEAIHAAMLARGFDGRMPRFREHAFNSSDTVFAVTGIAAAALIRVTAL